MTMNELLKNIKGITFKLIYRTNSVQLVIEFISEKENHFIFICVHFFFYFWLKYSCQSLYKSSFLFFEVRIFLATIDIEVRFGDSAQFVY